MYSIAIWHGEGRTVYYLVYTDKEDSDIHATFRYKGDAEHWRDILNNAAKGLKDELW